MDAFHLLSNSQQSQREMEKKPQNPTKLQIIRTDQLSSKEGLKDWVFNDGTYKTHHKQQPTVWWPGILLKGCSGQANSKWINVQSKKYRFTLERYW